MEPSEFPLDKSDRRLTELSPGAEQRPALYRYEESASTEVTATPGYQSLRDYWYILLHHKMTLLCFALGGLLAAIVISLLQTPIYRARTSLEIQDFNEN